MALLEPYRSPTGANWSLFGNQSCSFRFRRTEAKFYGISFGHPRESATSRYRKLGDIRENCLYLSVSVMTTMFLRSVLDCSEPLANLEGSSDRKLIQHHTNSSNNYLTTIQYSKPLLPRPTVSGAPRPSTPAGCATLAGRTYTK